MVDFQDEKNLLLAQEIGLERHIFRIGVDCGVFGDEHINVQLGWGAVISFSFANPETILFHFLGPILEQLDVNIM